MGDDPHLPAEMTATKASNHSAAARSGDVIVNEHHHGFTKGQSFVVVSVSFLALGLAVSAVVLSSLSSAVMEREIDRSSEDAARAEREARMLQYYVLEMDAKLIAAGFKTDAESVAKRLKENGK